MQTLQVLLALRIPEDCRRGIWAIVLFFYRDARRVNTAY
jgi:hypothetical protein